MNNTTVANTVAKQHYLNGGTLSVGGNATTTYSGAIAVNSSSRINMRSSNSSNVADLSIATTISGPLSGAGALTVTGNSAVTAGNQIGSTLTLSGNNSGWSGDLTLERGTVTFSGANAHGTGLDVDADKGRIIFSSPGGSTLNMNSITVDNAAGGILELNPDASGTPVTDMVVNVNGPVTLGSATSGTTALRINSATDERSIVNFNGGIILGNTSSVSTAGATSRNVTIQTVGISETGGSQKLFINDDFGPAIGTWNQTNRALHIAAAGSYTGGTDLYGGTLILGHKDALGTGALTINATSTLQASTDLSGSGAGPVPNALNVNAGLTVSGINNLTISGATDATGVMPIVRSPAVLLAVRSNWLAL